MGKMKFKKARRNNEKSKVCEKEDALINKAVATSKVEVDARRSIESSTSIVPAFELLVWTAEKKAKAKRQDLFGSRKSRCLDSP